MEGFRNALLQRMSPHLSSQALQFWLNESYIFSSRHGLYEFGGSGRATKLVRWLLRAVGLSTTVQEFCSSKTLNEQREIWPKLRRVLLSRFLHRLLIGSRFLWKAAGVPPAQAAMITRDHHHEESFNPSKLGIRRDTGEAMWQYVINTLDPVARDTLLSDDNFYYLLTLCGRYTRRYEGSEGVSNVLKLTRFAAAIQPICLQGLMRHCRNQALSKGFASTRMKSTKSLQKSGEEH